MARSAQLVTNGDASAGIAAPWVALTNVMQRTFGSFTHIEPSFSAQNGGAYHFVQDCAVPIGDIAAIDAGTRAVDYDAYGVLASGTSTLTMYLEARDAGGAVLLRWELGVTATAKPYQQFTVRMARLPVGTRTLRAGFQGVNNFNGGGWFDTITLYTDDFGVTLSKGNLYVASGVPSGLAALTKGLAYAVLGLGFAKTLGVTKNVLYAVTGLSTDLVLTKGVMYVVTGPVVRCGYDGMIVACADRPGMNTFEECGDRPESALEASGDRPTNSYFKSGNPFDRCSH